MFDFLMRRFTRRCFWFGHMPRYVSDTELIEGRHYEVIKCYCCDKILAQTLLRHKNMKVRVEILEDVQDDLSDM